jgi:shikimate kinase
MNSIVLIGFMGSGKTTVGQTLAAVTGQKVIDLDAEITKKIGMSIDDFFATQGEAAFREIERDTLARFVTESAIIATGGGIVVNELNRQLLDAHPAVVYLQTNPAELVKRIQADTLNIRPLAKGKNADEIAAILKPRLPWYEQVASLKVETTGKTPDKIAEEIITNLEAK